MVIAPYASAAFANGYAEVDGAPAVWPQPVRDAALAALEVAEAHADQPDTLGNIRKIGRQSALYHMLYAKRDDLEARFAAKLHPLVKAVAHMAAPVIANRLGAPLEAVSNSARDAAIAAAEAALQSMVSTPAYQDWLQLTSEALLEGTADGMAAGDLWMASTQGDILPAFDLRFSAALTRLRNLTGPWVDANSWMGKQLHGIAYQIGGDLANAIESNATREEMIQLIEDGVSGVTNADLMLNTAISWASSTGTLDLYRSEGVTYVNVLISPGACEEYCEPLDADNPYEIADDPGLPMHPNCRCSYSPYFSDPSQADMNLS